MTLHALLVQRCIRKVSSVCLSNIRAAEQLRLVGVLISLILRKSLSSNLASPMPLVKSQCKAIHHRAIQVNRRACLAAFALSRVSQRPPPGRAAPLSLTLAHLCSPTLTHAHQPKSARPINSPVQGSIWPWPPWPKWPPKTVSFVGFHRIGR